MSRGSRARVALGALALVAILFLFVFPTRSYIAQRHQVSTAQHDLQVLKQENAALQREAQRLQTKSVIEGMAREHFDWARPGEEIFTVLPPPASTTTTTP
jgi:cell division protein FtsB